MEYPKQDIIAFYENGFGEENRFSLSRALGIEFTVSMKFLTEYIPHGAHILDCCAGGGAYSFALAEKGYRVTAGDLAERHVNWIREHDTEGLLQEVYCSDVLDLSRFPDGRFDCVLCMGAMYHLFEEKERIACVQECLRVLKPGGIFVFAYINRLGVWLNHFANGLSDRDNQANILKTGQNGPFYCMAPGEAQTLADRFSLTKISDLTPDGAIHLYMNRLNTCSPEDFDAYLEHFTAVCEQPGVTGSGMHGLWIGKKGEEPKEEEIT